MARPVYEKGDTVVAIDHCGFLNRVEKGTEGTVEKDFYHGNKKVLVHFGSNYEAVYPFQVEAS